MSRCFPFPPPGYEIKAGPNDVSLIIKEKDKQKKHKDKKDKKKKERSEGKEKERSEGKHEERSERKEKGRSEAQHEKRSEGKEKERSEGKYEERSERKEKERNGGKHEERSERKEKERSEDKHEEDKDRKHKKHKGKKDKKKDKLRSSEEKKVVTGSLDNNQNGEKLVLDSKPSNGVHDYGILAELEKRVRNDGGATDSQMVHKIRIGEERSSNSGVMPAEAYDDIQNKREPRWMDNGQSPKFSVENHIKVKEKNKNENNVGKGDASKNGDQYKSRKAEEKKRKKEKKKERSKEKIKQRASDGNFLDFHDNNNPLDLVKESRDSQGKLPNHSEPISNGFLHDNGIRPNRISRPAISSHQVSQNGSGFHPSQNNTILVLEKGAVITNQKVNGKLSSSSQSMIKNVSNIEPGRAANNTTAEHVRTAIDNHVVSNGPNASHVVGGGHKMEPCNATSNVVKVEQIINNFRVDEKFQYPHPLTENGRKIADAIHKTGNKQLTMNGVLEGKIENSLRSSPASVEAKEKKVGTSSMKPPHPDWKYLSQILTVPRVECPQCDDQEWLFSCKDWDSQPKRPKLASSEIEWTKHVWAEAVQVESANVTAMPYVIPY